MLEKKTTIIQEEIIFLSMVRNNVKNMSMQQWLWNQIDNRINELEKLNKSNKKSKGDSK